MTVSSDSTEKVFSELGQDSLPEGWTRATVREVTENVPNVKPESEPEREFGYVDISSICNRRYRVIDLKRFRGQDAPSRAQRPIQANDVLFSNVRTYLRNIALVPENLDAQLCSTGFTVLRSNGAIDPRLLFHQVLTDRFIDLVTPQQTGSQYPATSDRVVMAASIPLPPLSEHHRIVDKIEKCLAHVNSARDRLSRVPAILKRFRQAVLTAASSGRLTEDFPRRLDMQDMDSKPGFPDEELPRIADSWRWVRVGDVGKVKGGKRLPKGQTLVADDTGYPYIRAGNLKDGTVRGEILFLTPAIQKKIARYTVKSGDVYVTIVGACIGDAGTIPDEFDGANLTENAAKITELTSVRSSYLAIVLRSPFLQDRILDRIHSASQGKLALHRIAALPIPLPHLEEQEEIVCRVKALFRLADTIEHRVARTQTLTDKLTQSVLSKAFRGELVPTEAELARREGREYEPALALLERIKKERNSATPPKATRQRTRPEGTLL